MASWKKHFKIWDPQAEQTNNGPRQQGGSTSKFASWLQDVYTGQPNRVERYSQYDQMDQDSEVNAALDTISEFCTQEDPITHLPFALRWSSDPTPSESQAISETLKKWCSINGFDQKLFRTFRSAIKFGDHFFLRDPETFELYWVNPGDVKRAVINEAEGRKVEQYVISNLHPNLGAKVATKPIESVQSMANAVQAGPNNQYNVSNSAYKSGNTGTEVTIDAKDIMHISLSEGLDANWPFGASILDSVFKIYKQKELLEDAIIIYRVQRAPERRVFYIDTGNLPSHQAMGFLERVKNEIHQRRIPTRSGGGTALDASYNPLSIMEDFFFAQSADGRGSKVEVLPGGTNLGEIDDLKFFSNKLMRGLRIPSSYMPTGPDDSAIQLTDGRVGTALIQEYRFNRYCQRLQGLIMPMLSKEFKTFVKHRGINVDTSSFEIDMLEPQNFSDYRQIEVNNARASVFTQLAEVPYMSHRFKLQKFLGLTDAELLENEKLWLEENKAPTPTEADEQAGFGDIGGGAGGGGLSDGDMDFADDLETAEPAPDEGGESAPTEPEA